MDSDVIGSFFLYEVNHISLVNMFGSLHRTLSDWVFLSLIYDSEYCGTNNYLFVYCVFMLTEEFCWKW
jgi:hypothetical protein